MLVKPVGLLGGFSPASFGADLQLWLRASADNITLNGSDVSGWADLSRAGNDAVQATANDQPAWNSSNSEFNDTPTVDFAAGNTEFMAADGAASIFSGDDTAYSIFMCLRYTGTVGGSIECFASAGISTDNAASVYLRVNSGSGNKWGLVDQDTVPASSLVDSTTIVTNNPTIVGGIQRGTSIEIFVGKTSEASAASNLGAVTFDQFSLGVLRRSTNSLWASMELAEIVAVDRALDSNEVGQLVDWMANGRGITV